jgi:hypothetical protein
MALTNAERQKRFREKLKAQARSADTFKADSLGTILNRLMREGYDEIYDPEAEGAPPNPPELSDAEAEAWEHNLRHTLAEWGCAKDRHNPKKGGFTLSWHFYRRVT